MNVPNDIQVQVDFRGIKRAFVTSEPQSYDELLSLIHSRIKNINISASCLMYENDEGDFVLLAKDANSLAIAVQSSRKIHGVDLKRLKLKVLECTSPTGTTHQHTLWILNKFIMVASKPRTQQAQMSIILPIRCLLV